MPNVIFMKIIRLCTVCLYCADWNKDPGGNLRKLWPGWDKNLNDDLKKKFHISDISKFKLVYFNPVACFTRPFHLCSNPGPPH